jgi:threonine dehydratase
MPADPGAPTFELDWQRVATAVGEAGRQLAGRIVLTPTVPSPWLSHEVGGDVHLKLENVQHTGSFKLRGATFALQQLAPAVRAAGVVAASSGNHGLAVAAASARLGVRASVCVPTTTPVGKREAIAAAGAEVLVHGDDCVLTEAFARDLAGRTGRHYVSPYNDADVIAGQGTVAVELLQQWPPVERIYVAVGGGGLLAGMAAFVRAHRPDVVVVACSPAASPALDECVRQGAVVDVACGDTLSDSTAGGVEPGAISFPLCRDLVRTWQRVDEAAIADALRATLAHQHLLVEGAAAVAIAALRADPAARGRRSAVVVCGGNLPFALLRRLLA